MRATEEPNQLMNSYLSKITITLSMALCVVMASCGKGQKGKPDTVDALVDEMVEQVNRLPDAMLSIKDKASAEQAAVVIGEVGDKLVDVAMRMDQLEVPSDEEKKRIAQKIEKGIKEGDGKIRGMDAAAMADPEVRKITKEAMTAFMEKMKKPEEIFEKYGKGYK